jgi:hypothetical protein
MPYKPTGNPPGRPRKPAPVETQPEAAEAVAEASREAPANPPPPVLKRSRRQWREHYQRVNDAGDGPMMFDRRGRQIGKRPQLHPHVTGNNNG